MTRFYQNGTINRNIENCINIPANLTGPSYNFPNDKNNAYKEGVYLQTNHKLVTVIGLFKSRNFDTYFAIPIIDTFSDNFIYYAISVATYVRADGSVVIVGTADQTIVNITVPVQARIKVNNSADWSTLHSGTLYSYKIQRLQIVYIAAYTTDLTGTKVTTNKPISLFSGHECAFIPYSVRSCDHLVEQIPPTELWGTVYYFAPLASRTTYTIKVIAAYDSTNFDIYCNNTVRNYSINAGEFTELIYSNQEYCGVYANQKVLVVQFSHSYGTDSQGDPLMTLIPATTHYTNSFISSTFQSSEANVTHSHYINVIVLSYYYHPELISITTAGEVNQTLDLQTWVPIIRGNITHAYAAQVNISYGVFEVKHFNEAALMTMLVYGFESPGYGSIYFEGYGHPGWLKSQLIGVYIAN